MTSNDMVEFIVNRSDLIIIGEMLYALALGLMVGFERSYRGRAAGMRTYGFVCMAACAMTSISGYPEYWFGGQINSAIVDPTRIIQGIITGIGFLGAGVIMRDGLNISGLTTAASIWAASAVGILVGVGFYLPAAGLALILMAVMLWGGKLEVWFPTRHAVAVQLAFRQGIMPTQETVKDLFTAHGFSMARGSITTSVRAGAHEWRFVVVSMQKKASVTLITLSQALADHPAVAECQLSHARN